MYQCDIIGEMEKIREDEILLEAGEVTEYLRISRVTLYRFINEGERQGYKIAWTGSAQWIRTRLSTSGKLRTGLCNL